MRFSQGRIFGAVVAFKSYQECLHWQLIVIAFHELEEDVFQAGHGIQYWHSRYLQLNISACDRNLPLPVNISVGRAPDKTFIKVDYHFSLFQYLKALHGKDSSEEYVLFTINVLWLVLDLLPAQVHLIIQEVVEVSVGDENVPFSPEDVVQWFVCDETSLCVQLFINNLPQLKVEGHFHYLRARLVQLV